MQDQPVVSVAPEGLRHDLLELRLDLVDILAGREAGAVADAEDMRVDGERLLAEGGVQYYVGGLACYSGQAKHLFHRLWDLATEFTHDNLGSAFD